MRNWIAPLVIAALLVMPVVAADTAKPADPAKPAEGGNLVKATNKAETWRLEQHEGGKGKLKTEDDAITFETTETSGTEWHVQAIIPALELKEGQEYTLKFKAKGAPDREIPLNAGIDEDDWHMIGLTETVSLTKDWKDYEYTFKAEGVAAKGKNRISFIIGADKGTVSIKDLTLTAKK